MLILGYVCLRNLSKFRWRNNVLFKVSVDIHVKKIVSSFYGGEHVAIPHPATSTSSSSRQQLGARLMFGILQNCTKLSDTSVSSVSSAHIGQ